MVLSFEGAQMIETAVRGLYLSTAYMRQIPNLKSALNTASPPIAAASMRLIFWGGHTVPGALILSYVVHFPVHKTGFYSWPAPTSRIVACTSVVSRSKATNTCPGLSFRNPSFSALFQPLTERVLPPFYPP
jgi:hypothetical protein